MTGRSNWEYKNAPSATERLKAALSRPVNEAIRVDEPKAKEPTMVKTGATPGLLGSGAAANAARALRGRKGQIDAAGE